MPEHFFLQPMRVEHIPQVGVIERLAFTQPWPAHAYKREIQDNRMAYYQVARVQKDDADGPDGLSQAGAAQRQDNAGGPVAQSPSRLGAPSQEPGLIGRLGRLLRPSAEPPPPQLEAELRSIVGYAGLWLMTDEAHVTTIAVHPDYRGRGVGELLLLGLIDHAMKLGAKWVTLEVRVTNDVAIALYHKYTFKEMGVRKGYYSDNREDALVMWTDPLESAAFKEVLERNRAQLRARLDGDG